MMRYSFQPRDQIFVKGYGFLSLGKNMGKKIGENISQNLISKRSHKFLDKSIYFWLAFEKGSWKKYLQFFKLWSYGFWYIITN